MTMRGLLHDEATLFLGDNITMDSCSVVVADMVYFDHELIAYLYEGGLI